MQGYRSCVPFGYGCGMHVVRALGTPLRVIPNGSHSRAALTEANVASGTSTLEKHRPATSWRTYPEPISC